MNRAAGDVPRTFFDQRMTEVVQLDVAEGHAVVFSSRCPNKSTANEDALAVVPVSENSGVLIVADGMGGHSSGELAARTAVEEIVSAVKEAIDNEVVIRSAIIDGFEKANEKVLASGTGGGTTLSVLEIDNGYARPYHAGDSMILIAGSKGKVKLQTVPHSPVGFGVEAGLIDSTEAMHHEDGHVILNSVGCDSMRIEIGTPIKMAKRDTALLATDGLSDNLTINDIVNGIRSGTLSHSISNLTELCQLKMNSENSMCKPDDLTIIAYRQSN